MAEDLDTNATETEEESVSAAQIISAVLGLVFFAMIVVCGGMIILPAERLARQETCRENLREIGDAMTAYVERHGGFPPAVGTDENGNPLHSWRASLVDDMQPGQWDYRLSEPHDSEHNRRWAMEMPPMYHCPGDTFAEPSSETSYLMVTGRGTVGQRGQKGIAREEIQDGAQHTIMAVEAAGSGINWLEPRDWDTSDADFTVNQETDAGIASQHPGVANVLMADGSVRTISESVDPEVLKAYTTSAGNEKSEPLPTVEP